MASSQLLRKSFWDTSWTPCKLNNEACLSLDLITSSFSAPITEEHAWAIVFECVKCLQEIVEADKQQVSTSQRGKSSVFVVTCTQQIYLHRDGRVHASTFLHGHDSSSCKYISPIRPESKQSRPQLASNAQLAI